MFVRFILAMAIASFTLGLIKPQLSSQAHLVISLGTYLFVWVGINAYEKRQPNPQSQLLVPLLWLVIAMGVLSLVAEFLPVLEEPVLFLRAVVFLFGLVYCFSSTFRLFTNSLFSKFSGGK